MDVDLSNVLGWGVQIVIVIVCCVLTLTVWLLGGTYIIAFWVGLGMAELSNLFKSFHCADIQAPLIISRWRKASLPSKPSRNIAYVGVLSHLIICTIMNMLAICLGTISLGYRSWRVPGNLRPFNLRRCYRMLRHLGGLGLFITCLEFYKHGWWEVYTTGYDMRFQNMPLSLEKLIKYIENASMQSTEYFISDLWFDMVVYLSESDDGVRLYHTKHQWLESFILPGPSDSSRILAEEFQAARIAFELKPAEFIRHIEKFSKILKTRDLCDLLMEYFEKGNTMALLNLWIDIQAEIVPLMELGAFRTTDHHVIRNNTILEGIGIVISSRSLHNVGSDSKYSAAIKLQSFLKRSLIDVSHRRTSKSCNRRGELRSVNVFF